MKHADNSKLFHETLRLYGRDYSLAVFLMFNSDRTNYYRCILDDIKVLDLWVDDHGRWIDMHRGFSELGCKLGETIEAKVLPGNKRTVWMKA